MTRSSSQSGKARFANVSVIVLDVGDTLFPATALMTSSLRRTARELKKLGLITDSELFCKTYLEVDRRFSGPSVNHLFSGVDIIEQALAAFGLSPSPQSVGTFLGFYRDLVRRGIRRDPRLFAVLAFLRRSGYRFAVLSDGSTEEQMEQLFRLGILELLDAVVTSQKVGIEKPSRQMFEFLLSSLSVKPNQAVMVGNDPIRDAGGAASMGMASILVTRYSHSGATSSKADLLVPDVLSLKQVFAKNKHART